MSRLQDLIDAARANPKGTDFGDLVKIVEGIGYKLARTRGSHRIYKAPGLPMINLQSAKPAKRYQVDQVLDIIDEFKLQG